MPGIVIMYINAYNSLNNPMKLLILYLHFIDWETESLRG